MGKERSAKAAEVVDMPSGQPAKLKGRAEQARSLATRSALLAAARELFGRQGFHATGTTEVVAKAAVTRGALYHHFATKEDLFEAVSRQIAAELPEAVAEATHELEGDTWPRTIASLRAHLRLMVSSSETQRILLIDGPVVLGWRRWWDLQAESYLEGMVVALDKLVKSGIIDDQPKEPLAHLIIAALNDAALTIAHSSDRETTWAEMADALTSLFSGLRTRAPR